MHFLHVNPSSPPHGLPPLFPPPSPQQGHRRPTMQKMRLLPTLSRSTLPLLSSTFSSTPSSCRRQRPLTPSPSAPDPPVPKKVPFTVSAHRRSWVDPYHWMSNTQDPDFVEYLTRENSYAAAFMADTEGLRSRLVAEMKGRMLARVDTPPEKWGPWWYYQYFPEDKEYPVLCRRLGSNNGFAGAFFNRLIKFRKEEILLDWNKIAEKHGYVHIGTCRVSPNHRFLAYTMDTSGGESFVLYVKDLQTGCIVQNSRVEGVVSVAWSKDSNYLLYTICDETLRPYRVHCKKLGSDVEDNFLFAEDDTVCCVDITSTKDGKFITINSNSRSSSEVYVMDAANLRSGLKPVRKRAAGVQYFLEHHNGYFYILTNALENVDKDIGDYHIARCGAEDFRLNKWQDIILPGKNICFHDLDIFNGHLVLFLHKDSLPMLCSIDMPICADSKVPMEVEELHPWFFPMPSNICSIVPGSNHDFMATTYRAVISSPIMPDMIVDFDMSKKKFMVVHQEIVGPTSCIPALHLDSVDSNVSEIASDPELKGEMGKWSDLSRAYVCERKEVVSHDGVRVPLTILYSQKAGSTGQSPGLLHGYGAYGEALDKSWCPDRISLLDRGWVVAFADVRGGGGGDTSWHQAGTGLNKLNSVQDFVACAKFLIDEGYVHKSRLSAIGFSAGGLLIGSTINIYCDLFSAAILKVPFLDICNTMLDSSLPLTMLDYEEFGDPRIESCFEMLHSYSPYDNIQPGICPPPVLVTASFNDSRVGVWEAAKWVAQVRDSSGCSCSRGVILKTNMSAGHFGEGGRYRHCEDTAFEYAFLMKVMGMDNIDESST